MVAVCSETGYLMALPLKSKNQMSLITHELMAFTQVLAIQTPTSRQILRLLVAARSAMTQQATAESRTPSRESEAQLPR